MSNSVVRVGPIRVLVSVSKQRYFAQSLEIDYFAEGLTKEEVVQNFIDGFYATISYLVENQGNVQKFAVQAPENFWKEFYEHFFDNKLSILKKVPLRSSVRLPFNSFHFLVIAE